MEVTVGSGGETDNQVSDYPSKNQEGVMVAGYKLSANEWNWLNYKVQGDRCENCTSSSWEFRICEPQRTCGHSPQVQLVLNTDEAFQRASKTDMDLLIKGGNEKAEFRIDCDEDLQCEMCNPFWLRISYFPCDGRASCVQNIPIHVVT
jgi:hypothetical protein